MTRKPTPSAPGAVRYGFPRTARAVVTPAALRSGVDAHDDTQAAHLLAQEKARHPEGDLPQVRIGRAATSSKTEQTSGSGATLEIPGSEGESVGSVFSGSAADDTDTVSDTDKTL